MVFSTFLHKLENSINFDPSVHKPGKGRRRRKISVLHSLTDKTEGLSVSPPTGFAMPRKAGCDLEQLNLRFNGL